MSKNKIQRLEYKLEDFFVNRLSFKNNLLKFGENIKLFELINLLGINIKEAQKILKLPKNKDILLNNEQIAELAMSKNIEFEQINEISEINILDKIIDLIKQKKWPELANVVERPPVVTIMGHVDHGKTTLLDTIRKSNITKKEVGGITQSIGAYQVEWKGQKITFIDTPGHETFTEMRANGSQVTDIVIILVAANDSIMNQTKESIDHAKSAKVPIIIAINKIDLPSANVEKVKQDLTDYGIVPEEWGGTVPFVEISALNNKGINLLLETLILQKDMLELKSPENILAVGTVIESNVDKKRGNLVSVIINYGTLLVGDDILIDDFIARVKGLKDDKDNLIKEAKQGMPVEIFGLGKSPKVGSKFVVVKGKYIQKIATKIHNSKLDLIKNRKISSIDDLFQSIENKKKEFNIILKADSLGVLQAISTKLETLSNEEVNVRIIRKDIGEITNTDVSLAEASNASIYTFNVKQSAQIEGLIRSKQIRVFNFDIVYKLFEDIEQKVSGMVEEKFEEVKIGQAEILRLFHFSKIGTIAGCIMRDGIAKDFSNVKVFRGKDLIFEGNINSLKVEKNPIKEVRQGQECGITFKNFNDFKEGDIIEFYELKSLN